VNLGIDLVLGSVPILGDALDVAWKANLMNARLLDRALDDPKATGRSSFWVLLGLSTLLLALIAGTILLVVWLIQLLVHALR